MNKKNNSRKYLETDPFNPEITFECEVSMDKNERYGMLTIHKINGDKLKHPQVIYGTPKLKYPFDQNGNWHFPSAKRIFSYQKYDGTNIFMYRYKYKDRFYTTYKVRLFPFLRGPILTMWRRCLQKYSQIPQLFAYYPALSGFSFEMYGSDNPHLIEYEHKLDARLLFGLKQENELEYENVKSRAGKDKWTFVNKFSVAIVPLCDLEKEHWNPNSPKIPDVPIADCLNFHSGDYIYYYQNEQQQFSRALEETESGFKGHEGSVWYLLDKQERWHLFKCKPNEIEKIHWAAYPIDSNVIKATAHNVFEVYSQVTHDNLCELLLEEFPKQQVELSQNRIQKVLEEFDEKSEFQRRVDRLMQTEIGEISGQTVPEILRVLSKHFEKREMSSVYQAVCHTVSEVS